MHKRDYKVRGAISETNDCAVMAVASLLSLDYETVHKAMEDAGRVQAGGTPVPTIRRAVEALGFRIRRRYSGERLALEFHKRRITTAALPRENTMARRELPDLLLLVPGHACAFVSGQVRDWTNEKEAPIEEAWELEPVGAQKLSPREKAPEVVYL